MQDLLHYSANEILRYIANEVKYILASIVSVKVQCCLCNFHATYITFFPHLTD